MVHDKVKVMYALVYQGTHRLNVLRLFDDFDQALKEAYKLNEEVDNIMHKVTPVYGDAPVKGNKARVRKCLVSIDDE